MFETPIRATESRASPFQTLRFQLLFNWFAAVALPAIIAVGLPGQFTLAAETISNSLIAAFVAASAATVAMRRFAAYPGATSASYVLPTCTMVYAVVLAAILITRAEYSNSILLASYVGALVARYAIASLNSRQANLTFFLVPGGRVERVGMAEALTFLRLDSPREVVRGNSALIADLHFQHAPEWERYIAEAAISGVPVYHYKQVVEATTGKVQIEHLSENSFGSLIPGHVYPKVKRIADTLLALIVLPFLAVPMAAVAMAIRLDSHGPALFRQQRIGYRGEKFEVIKFRTMTSGNSAGERDAAITQTDDNRITRLGRFLRRTRIDELPQLFNIIRGEMSWIGPRPEAVGLSRWYEEEIPFYRYRHIVRPGITGWAQVNQGHVSSLVDVDHKLRYDFYYVKNFSYWIDLLIVFRTFKVVLGGFGAK